MREVFKKIFTFFILSLILLFTLINSSLIIKSVLTSTNIFVNKLFPSMFFFYTIADLLINYNFINIIEKLLDYPFRKILHIRGYSIFIVIISMLSGFPSGSIYITELLEKNLITENTANYLLTFTHFSNPLFILGVIASIFNQEKAILILIIHYLSNFILAFLIKPKKIENINYSKKNLTLPLPEILKTSFLKNFKILLIILGNTIFFYTISEILTYYIDNNIIKTMINGVFDLTKGIIETKKLGVTDNFKLILVLTFISLGGININFQVREIINKTKLKYKYFIFGRVSAASISIILITLLENILF